MYMDMRHAGSPPQHILGYTIRSRTRIYVSYILPTCLALIVYIAQTTVDLALSYQLFKTNDTGFAIGTLILVLLPPTLTFTFVLTSKQHRANASCGLQSLQLIFFPFSVAYRFSKRLFWAIEALFHENDDVVRMECLANATQTSSIELYLFIQAFAQAAPQIILQLYHMLAQDLFRNYETSTVQGLCLVFSAIDLAAITTSFHRFESQRRIGRQYPWATEQQLEVQRCKMAQNERLYNATELKKRISERSVVNFPESDKIIANFHAQAKLSTANDVRSHDLNIAGEDEVDNEVQPQKQETKALLHRFDTDNITDDDKIQNIRPKLQLRHDKFADLDAIEVLDTVPESPAPRPPPNTAPPALPSLNAPSTEDMSVPNLRRTMSDSRRSQRTTRPISQLEIFADMWLINAQLYIKNHVPHPPKLLTTRVDNDLNQEKTPLSPQTPLNPEDDVDFYFPQPAKIIDGIQEDDFAGKTVAFFGWIAFIIMRMLALATFCIFYPKPFLIVVCVHYLLMLAALGLESRFRGTWNRTLFYLLLAYVYIFVLLEFRVCFKHIRIWYSGFLVLSLAENVTMSAIWYVNAEFDSWWFTFIWKWIVWSGILFLATIVVYYCILRPKNVSLVIDNNTPALSDRTTVA